MKRKYYLRGIGVGILFSTIVLLVAYIASGRGQMTDDEIRKRAKELGMVETESELGALDKPADKKDTAEDEPVSSIEEASEDTSEENSEGNSDDTEEPSETSDTEEPSTDSTENTTEEAKPQERMVTFTVVSGMNSWNVAVILQDQGVIESAAEFDAYLEANGYSSRIATGEYKVSVGADFETIAKMITGQ